MGESRGRGVDVQDTCWTDRRLMSQGYDGYRGSCEITTETDNVTLLILTPLPQWLSSQCLIFFSVREYQNYPSH